MLFKTLFFNPTLFRKNLARFWPLWTISLAMWLLWVPARIFGGAVGGTNAVAVQDFVDKLLVKTASQSYIFGAGLGLVAALTVYSYLFQSRSAITIHALPFRRNCLFFTNYLSGLVMLVGPLLAAAGVTIGVEVFCDCLNLSGLFMWLTVQLLSILFFYSFGVFCAMLTGNMVACPLFYVGISALPYAISEVLGRVCSRFLFGYDGNSGLQLAAQWLTPFYNCMKSVNWGSKLVSQNPDVYLYYMNGWKPLLIYAGVGCLLVLASALLYTQRHTETAGEVVAFPVLRPIFKYVVTGAGALCLTEIIYTFVMPNGGQIQWKPSLLLYLILVAVGVFVSYYLAEMMLEKTLWVFRGHWKGYALATAAMLLLICAIHGDVVRYETHLPQLREVASVSISGGSGDYWDNQDVQIQESEFIAQVLDAHQAVIDHKKELREQYESYQQGCMYSDYDEDWFWNHDQRTFTIRYTLLNGSTISRSYSLCLDQEQLTQESDCPQNLWNKLVTSQTFVLACYQWLWEEEENLRELDLNTVTLQEEGYSDSYVELRDADAQLVLEALQEDLLQGGLSAGSLKNENDPEVYDYNSLYLYYRAQDADPFDESGTADDEVHGHGVMLTAGAENTLRVLSDLGVLDENHVLASSQWIREQDFWENYVYTSDSYDAGSRSYLE